jgi:hypothetical protein
VLNVFDQWFHGSVLFDEDLAARNLFTIAKKNPVASPHIRLPDAGEIAR